MKSLDLDSGNVTYFDKLKKFKKEIKSRQIFIEYKHMI